MTKTHDASSYPNVKEIGVKRWEEKLDVACTGLSSPVELLGQVNVNWILNKGPEGQSTHSKTADSNS